MSLLVKDILIIGKNQLEVAGIMDPKIDAELLFCHMMGIDKSKLFLNWSQELSDTLCEKYFTLLAERTSGVPLQYITGWQEFMGLRFAVNGRVLIPRQDTESLVETALMAISDRKLKKVLDLCTGSGVIAISIDRHCAVSDIKTKLEVIASDISAEALKVAKQNAQALGASNIKFVQGDLFAPFKKKFRNSKFNLIISNPPYIKSDVIPTLQTEVKEHEPLVALDGGADGLDFLKRIITEAPLYLKEKGMLLLEIGFDQAADIKKLAAEIDTYHTVEVYKDLAGRDRVAVLCI